MEVVYNEKDQAVLDQALKTLNDYEALLMKLYTLDTNDMDEIFVRFNEDLHRKALIEALTNIYRSLIPKYVVKVDKLDPTFLVME